MAKKTYKARFAEFVEAIKAVGEVKIIKTISGNEVVVTVKRENLENLLETVKDFVTVKEYPDNLKPYRNSSHYVSYAMNTNSYGHLNIEFENEDPEIVFTEDMISNYRSFNNCGEFILTVDNKAYNVRYQNDGKQIETDAPDHIKKALVNWWFI